MLSAELAPALIAWYRQAARDLPWRHDVTPYRVWVSEIMLQQTRVEAVKPYFQRFMDRLPTVADLAHAPEEVWLKLWEGLGYYSRVRNLHRAACVVCERYGGELPCDEKQLLALPGIGPYTAGAILSFAMGKPVPAVDGNVMRVLARLTDDGRDITAPALRREYENMLRPLIPPDAASDFGQGLIELGATLCGPDHPPACEACPLARLCRGYVAGHADALPNRARPAPRRIEERTVLILRDGRRVALRRRPDSGLLAGLWELPGVCGRMSRDEAVAWARGEGYEPVRVRQTDPVKHVFTHMEWHMSGYLLELEEAQERADGELRFLLREEVARQCTLPSAFRGFLKYL